MLVRPCLRFSVHLFRSRRRLCLRMSWASSVWPRHATMVSGGKPCESLPLTSPPAVNSCFTSAQLLARVTLPRILCSMTLRSSSVALFVAAAVVEFVVVLKNPHQAVQEEDEQAHPRQPVAGDGGRVSGGGGGGVVVVGGVGGGSFAALVLAVLFGGAS